MRLLADHGVDVVFDIGANIGQYALQMRDLGFTGWIVSYEPLSSAFSHLSQAASHDAKWRVVHAALGPTAGTATLNVAGNSQSSSLLPMLDVHLRAAPESAYVGTETITVETLEAALAKHAVGTKRFLKIDAQGYERVILESGRLDQLVGIQLEMSLVPLYEGESTMTDTIAWLDARGFVPMSLEPGYCDPKTGRLLQVDGIFFRT
jgi:FkbM family methyltransferase